MKSTLGWYYAPQWLKNVAGITTAVALFFSPLVPFAALPTPALAVSTVITSDGFGTGTDNNDVPGWEEHEGGTIAREGQGSGEDIESPEGGRLAKIAEDSNDGGSQDGYICKKFNAEGYENLIFSYYWNGDDDSEGASDFGVVEYRATSNGSTSDTCGSNENSWTVLATHDLSTESDWSDLQALNLPVELNNDDSFFVRFRNNSSADDEYFRVDGVKLEGDEIKTTIQIKKLVDLDGNLQTTDDQTPASGWNFFIDENGPYTTDETGMTVAVEVEDNKNYDLAEVVQEHYSLLSASCVGAHDNGDFDDGEIDNVKLKIGEEALCTFINAPDRGSITVAKVLSNNEGGTLDAEDFALEVSDGEDFSEVGNGSVLADDLIPGTYYLSEESEEGYEQTSIECSVGETVVPVGQDGSLVLGAGQDILCEITNAFVPSEEEQCVVTIYSDTANTVVEKEGAFALALSFIHSAWTATIGGATWIWGDNPVAPPVNGVVQTFEKTFEWNGPVTSATLTVAADNSYVAEINGSPAGADAGEFNYTLAGQDVYNVASLIQTGDNEISIEVTNKPGSADPAANPAGLLYKLEIVGTDKNCNTAPKPIVNTCALPETEQGPELILIGSSNEETLQSILNDEGYLLDVEDDQVNYQTWQTNGLVNVSFEPMLLEKIAGAGLVFGYYLNGDLDTFEPLFRKGSHPSFPAVPEFSIGQTASFSAANFNDIGFAIHVKDGDNLRVYATEASLNSGGEDHVIVYNPESNEYVLAFEDRPLPQADKDYNDMVVKVAITGCTDAPLCEPGVELLENGNFEFPVVTNSAKWDIFPSGTSGLGWVVEWFGGAATFNSQNRPLVANAELQKHSLNGWNAVGGVGQWTELDSDWVGPSGSLNGEPGSVSLSQTVLTEIGETYTFSFDFSPRPNTAAGQNEVEVLVNNVVIGTVGPTAGAGNTAWTSHEFSFVADSLLSTVTVRDAGTPNDSLGAFVDNASLMCTPPEEPKFASVTLCKVNGEEEPLAGWTLLLEKGDAVDSFIVPSTSSAGTDSAPLTAGTSYVALATGTWNNQGGANVVDAEYSTIDSWATQMDGYTGYQDDILELQIAQTSGAWGAYNSLHSYAQSFVPGVTGPVNFRIFDGVGTTPNESWYGDNSGSLNVVITEGYAGITGENGCVTFANVPYGSYDLSEMLQDGWVADAENPNTAVIDSPEEVFTLVNDEVGAPGPTATLHATKIVCEAEEYLPNWGNGVDGPTSIDATTATAWLAEGDNAEYCWLAPDWEFQWVTNADSSSNPGDNSGEAASPWTTFGLTDENGVITTQIPADDQVWVREVLKDGYVPFSGQNTHLHESAELYCGADVLNYDNWDFISPVVADTTYYCVAFNAELPPQCDEDEELVNNLCVPIENDGESYSDLEIQKTVNDANPSVGDFVTYTITVTNDGHVAGNVVVTENLPSGLSYVSHSASNGNEMFNSGTGVWTIASLGEGTATLTILAEVLSGAEGEELENSVTVTSDSNEENLENNEDGVSIFVNEEGGGGDEGDGGGGGSGPEIQTFAANGPISGLGGGPLGQVLGASTGEVLGDTCGLYMDKPIRFNRNNDAEQVRKLQTFLNKWLGLSLPITGFYGPLTYEAVLQFQTQYANTILTPWGLTSPTGIVYVTTLRQINMLECPALALELPPLVPWTN